MDKNLLQKAKAPMIALIRPKKALKGRHNVKHGCNPCALLLLLALCALTTTVHAQTVIATPTYDNVKYALWSDGTASVEQSPSVYATLNLRETITYQNNTYTLTRIANNAFFQNFQIYGDLTIPNSVTNIGNDAFYGCTGLTGTLTLPTALQHIGGEAFRECRFTGALDLPDGLLTIGNQAFYQCTSLTGQLNLPATLTSIGMYAFSDCTGFSGTLTLPPLLTEIGPCTFYGIQFTGDLVVPDGVTSIGNSAFLGNKFSSITIGDGVTTIGYQAFRLTAASQLTLGQNVATIGDQAFEYYDSDGSIQIECLNATPAQLGSNVFKNYAGSSMSFIVPCGAWNAYFYDDDWRQYTFFNLHEVASQNACIDGIYYALDFCGGTALVMNRDYTENYATISYSGNVVIPAEVTYLGYTLSVTEIANQAFTACQGITSITCLNHVPPRVRDNAFIGVSTSIPLYVPCSVVSTYQSYQSSTWNRFNVQGIPEYQNAQIDGMYYMLSVCDNTATVIYDASYATLDYVSIEDFEYMGTQYAVTAIADGAFDGLDNLLGVDCHSNISSIGTNAFRNCTGITYFGFYHTDTPSSVGESAFEGLGLDTLSIMVPFCSQYEYSVHPIFGQFGEIFGNGGCEYNFTNAAADKQWSNPANWAEGEVPIEGAQVGIMSDCEMDTDVTVGSITIGYYYEEEFGLYERLTVKSGATLTATNFIYTTGDERNFVIEDGAQVIHPNVGTMATVQKNITAYTPNTKNGWHLVSSPATESFAPSADNGFLANEYDLYYYHEPTHYWRNHKTGINNADPGFSIEPLKGYLYANSANDILDLTGTLRAATEMVDVPLSYTDGISLAGFNLVGNPFAHNVTAFAGSNVASEVYRMNDLKNEVTVSSISTTDPLLPGEGFFVKATAENASITFNSRSTNAERSNITLEVSENGLIVDRFILRLDGAPLEKFTLNENSTRIYATEDGKDWAVAVLGRDAARHVSTTDVPVNFKATKNGTYTLNVNLENIALEYLHLIDNMTGADVDLLVPDSVEGPATYTFAAKTTDYATRFRLVFNASDASTGSASDAPFAYIDNGDIRLSVETFQETSLQIVDMLGRVVVSLGDVSGNVSTQGMPAGVYVLRLIDGDSIRTQKIVID